MAKTNVMLCDGICKIVNTDLIGSYNNQTSGYLECQCSSATSYAYIQVPKGASLENLRERLVQPAGACIIAKPSCTQAEVLDSLIDDKDINSVVCKRASHDTYILK